MIICHIGHINLDFIDLTGKQLKESYQRYVFFSLAVNKYTDKRNKPI